MQAWFHNKLSLKLDLSKCNYGLQCFFITLKVLHLQVLTWDVSAWRFKLYITILWHKSGMSSAIVICFRRETQHVFCPNWVIHSFHFPKSNTTFFSYLQRMHAQCFQILPWLDSCSKKHNQHYPSAYKSIFSIGCGALEPWRRPIFAHPIHPCQMGNSQDTDKLPLAALKQCKHHAWIYRGRAILLDNSHQTSHEMRWSDVSGQRSLMAPSAVTNHSQTMSIHSRHAHCWSISNLVTISIAAFE